MGSGKCRECGSWWPLCRKRRACTAIAGDHREPLLGPEEPELTRQLLPDEPAAKVSNAPPAGRLPAARSGEAEAASAGIPQTPRPSLEPAQSPHTGYDATTADPDYPMYCLSMECFLGMSPDIPLPPHQELLREGMLTRCGAQTQVIFVSHEWLSFSHFDPHGDQVRGRSSKSLM